jgi:hypothetical protein
MRKNAPIAGVTGMQTWSGKVRSSPLRLRMVGLVLLALFAGILALGPIAQDSAYHEFADSRRLLGVPNFLDVMSGVPFLVVGVLGVVHCLARGFAGPRWSWLAFFGGTALVSLGSGYYHWSPGDSSLVWDRLPMSLAFMGLFVALVAEHAGESLERSMLAPALALGLASILWWRATADLRPYVWVQAAPLACIPCVMVLYPARYTHRRYLTVGLVLYGLAKLAEFWDREIFRSSAGIVGGHALKHVLAAGAVLTVLLMLRMRERIAPPPRL